jgi:hypothetical protein
LFREKLQVKGNPEDILQQTIAHTGRLLIEAPGLIFTPPEKTVAKNGHSLASWK